MIDTIIFILSADMYHISQPDKFTPAARWVDNAKHYGFVVSKQNPTQKELRAGIYKPSLTLSRRIGVNGTMQTMLKIELSLPKLLFGNNFDELQAKDFEKLAQKLTDTLSEMGVKVHATDLATASVSAIHYSKNIPLTDGSIPYHYINKMKEANIKLALDVNQTDYRNDGHSFKWHCNSYEIVFYDKIKELEKAKLSDKRTIEKDSALQLHLFEKFATRHLFEILRMEVRLNKRQKMKQLFAKLGIKSDFTFKSLFKVSIAKKILLHYLDEIESKRPLLFDYSAANDKALLIALMFNNPDLSAKQIITMYGLKKALEVATPRELQTMFGKRRQRGWKRLMKEASGIKLPLRRQPFGTVRECLEKFSPLRLNKLSRRK